MYLNFNFTNSVLLATVACCALLLLLIQYSMIIADIRNNRAKGWEIAVGMIPFGPYILMILTGLWHLFTMPFHEDK